MSLIRGTDISSPSAQSPPSLSDIPSYRHRRRHAMAFPRFPYNSGTATEAKNVPDSPLCDSIQVGLCKSETKWGKLQYFRQLTISAKWFLSRRLLGLKWDHKCYEKCLRVAFSRCHTEKE